MWTASTSTAAARSRGPSRHGGGGGGGGSSAATIDALAQEGIGSGLLRSPELIKEMVKHVKSVTRVLRASVPVLRSSLKDAARAGVGLTGADRVHQDPRESGCQVPRTSAAVLFALPGRCGVRVVQKNSGPRPARGAGVHRLCARAFAAPLSEPCEHRA